MLKEDAVSRIRKAKDDRLSLLNLSELRLDEIPEEIAELTWLTGLFASFNAISDLSILADLPNLQHLDLRGNQLQDLRPLSGLTELTYLDLAGNSIRDIEPLVPLSRLEILFLSDNRITELAPLKSASRLKRLYLSNNGLTSISPFRNLASLVELHLGNNNITDLEPLVSASRLEVLDITSNRVSDLEPLSQATLKKFFFGHNHIRDLSPLIGVIKRGVVLKSQDRPAAALNPLTTPPPEIVAQGPGAILNYFTELERQGAESLYEAKLLIIGEGGAGKTSLARKIESAANPLPEEFESTMGIDVRRLPLIEMELGRMFFINLWDFGGQEIYHSTHQFFLTHRSLYILVDDTRKDAKSVHDEVFAYWLQVVELLGGGSPLLIVQNEKSDRSKLLDLQSMQARFRFIKDSLQTNLATNRGLERVLDSIRHWLMRLEHVGEKLPKQWAQIRKDVSVLSQSTAHISLSEYFEICARNRIPEESRAVTLSEYLHDLGAFLHFTNDPILRNIVILQNAWATDAVYAILDDEIIKRRSGFFTQADLDRLWSGETYRHHHHVLMALMERFELCYKLLDHKPPTWLAPQLLPVTLQEFEWDSADNLTVRYEYDFMPKGILPRMIVRLNRYIVNLKTAWRSGIVLHRQETTAFVAETYARKEIVVRVTGNAPRELMTIVTEEIDRINSSYGALRVEKMIPCNCHTCQKTDTPHFYRYNNLQERMHRGKKTIECERSYDGIDVRTLLEGVFSVAVGKRYEDMKVFISYARQDEEYKKRLEAHLASLKLTQHLEVWSDSQIQAGEDWNLGIYEQLRTADIVLLLISEYFLASSYIGEIELRVAMERDERREAIVIPIFLRSCDCEGQPFMRLQGLPRKPVSKYRNREDAYTEISKGIRRRISELLPL